MTDLSFMVACSFFMIFCGLWSFMKYHKHLLNSLLSLEFMMLGIFLLLSFQMSKVGGSYLFFFVLFNSSSLWGGFSPMSFNF